MKFLKYDSKTEISTVMELFANYRKYLTDNRNSFPTSAYEFAIAEWHYNFSDPRCPHDSWVNYLKVSEISKDGSPKDRSMEIKINLLGAYHDGEIELTYTGIKGYSFSLLPDEFEKKHHGDWIIDEIYLSDKGWLIHEINFILYGDWKIECEDIKYEWKPFEKIND